MYQKYESFLMEEPMKHQPHFIRDYVAKLRPKRVLEIGCGYGRLLKRCAETGEFDAGGIELAESSMKLARQFVQSSVFLVLADALKLPFREKSFDVIYTSGVFMHIAPKDIWRATGEASRVSSLHIIHIEEVDRASRYDIFLHNYN